MQQTKRICGNKYQERYYSLGLWVLVILSSVLSALSSCRLHKLSNYVQLYEMTKTFLFCFSSRPEVHRSVIFSLSNDDKKQTHLKEVLEQSAPRFENQVNPMVNRPNYEGETPLPDQLKVRDRATVGYR